MTITDDQTLIDEAQKILNIYHFYRRDGKLYLENDAKELDTLFYAVVDAINACGMLKLFLPHKEFVVPSRQFSLNDRGWVEHFHEKDNRYFFLSDVYDFLRLFFTNKSNAYKIGN